MIIANSILEIITIANGCFKYNMLRWQIIFSGTFFERPGGHAKHHLLIANLPF
jgi:hypothetical protein